MTDREKLMELLDGMFNGDCCVDKADAVEYLIANGVTVQKHGRWEFVENKYCSKACCSCCGQLQGLYINGRKPEWEYCPNCGAKMDLKEE